MLTLSNSTIAFNLAGDGGGIENSGSLTLTTSIVAFNSTNGGGTGGIANSGTAILNNSTVAVNSGSTVGGINNSGLLTLSNSTVAVNSASNGAGGIFNAGTPNSIIGSIVADNHGSPNEGDCGSTLADGGYNLDSDNTCGFSTTNGSVPGKEPLFAGGPTTNGGPTATLALQSSSPAIDVIPTSSFKCPGADQRGVSRPDNSETSCDIGAYEFVDDADLGLTKVPANITTPATSASGAVVAYTLPTVVDEDSPLPTVSCIPASGSTFSIGTTTVTCTATDGDDTNSPVQASFTVKVTATDSDLGLTNVPANITVNASTASGAVVTYAAPTATDESGDSPAASVSCTPASGATFAIGTTTVTCTATDGDDSNSPVSASFTVKVLGAAAQVSNLLTTVNGYTNPSLTSTQKKTLNNKLQEIAAEINGGQSTLACTDLSGFIGYVKSQTGKGGMTAARATALIAAAQNIQVVLGC